jgi:Raf kinase inhibitor-like YbhB/YbcL family protein
MAFQLTSNAFRPGAEIPPRHTSDGNDISPPLHWTGTPAGTKSLALVVDDPDAPDPTAPKVDWVHWIVYDLPPDLGALPEGADGGTLPKGARQGLNDWKQPRWRGPAPPAGDHRYYFRLYALDTALPDLKQPTRAQLVKAMEGHVLARAELVGRYHKR